VCLEIGMIIDLQRSVVTAASVAAAQLPEVLRKWHQDAASAGFHPGLRHSSV
jgi:hypothetical protein